MCVLCVWWVVCVWLVRCVYSVCVVCLVVGVCLVCRVWWVVCCVWCVVQCVVCVVCSVIDNIRHSILLKRQKYIIVTFLIPFCIFIVNCQSPSLPVRKEQEYIHIRIIGTIRLCEMVGNHQLCLLPFLKYETKRLL